MKLIWAMTLLPLVAGCATVSKTAICDGTRAARDAHVAALIEDGGDRSVVTGANLIAILDAGCEDR